MEKEKKTLSPEEKKKEIWRAIKFTVLSASAGLIEMGSFALLTLLVPGWNDKSLYYIPASISLTLSVIWNFTLNRTFTFQSANNVPVAMFKVFLYYLVFGPLSIWLAQMYLVDTLGWNEFAVKAVVMIINFVTEFLYQRFFVFRDSIDTKVVKFGKNKEKVKEDK